MNKIFKLAALLSVCLMALAGCAPEELSTDQFSDEAVTLASFAPNPVARGGALRLVGSNLQKVKEVIIPGVDPITDIEVITEGRKSEIRVKVPVDGPQVGKIAIVTDGGKIESKTELSYSEPIVFTDFSPKKNAYPGTVITFTGDYMNNIKEVIFAGDVYVTEFMEQSRYKLKVVVPANAITGKVILGDVDENNNPDGLVANLFYSEDVLEVGQPIVRAVERGNLKVGDIVTVKGQYLNMIQGVAFGGVSADFTVSDDGQSLTTQLPATSADGELVLTSFAGDEFAAGTYTTKVPTGLAVAAETRFKAGLNATITGKDLDLVTSAALSGVAIETILTDGKLTFTIPAAAPDGTVVLTLANGKTVETEAIELVKPVITEVTPLELYAGDENIFVKGEDLDLVTGVSLGGKPSEFNFTEGTIEVVTALTSVSGKIALTLENGAVVESADAVKVNYHSLVIVTEMPAMQHIGQEVVLKGSNFALVENIFIGETKVTQYSIRTDEEVRFLMPWMKAGMYNMSFHLFNGDVETVATQIEVGLELDIKVIWEGSASLNWSGMSDLSWGGYDFSDVKPGTILTAYFTLDESADYWQVRFGNGSWSSLPSGIAAAGGEGNIPMVPGTTYYAMKLTAADIDMLQNQGGLVMTGANYTLTKLTLTSEISQETTLWEGEAIADDWGNQPYVLSDAGLELAAAGAQPGQIVYFYLEQIGADPWKVQIVEGHWGPTYVSLCAFGADTESGKFTEYDLEGNGGKISLTLTQEMLDAALTQQWWGGTFLLNGDNTKCTKITLL